MYTPSELRRPYIGKQWSQWASTRRRVFAVVVQQRRHAASSIICAAAIRRTTGVDTSRGFTKCKVNMMDA